MTLNLEMIQPDVWQERRTGDIFRKRASGLLEKRIRCANGMEGVATTFDSWIQIVMSKQIHCQGRSRLDARSSVRGWGRAYGSASVVSTILAPSAV
jgi:hypothetical protein